MKSKTINNTDAAIESVKSQLIYLQDVAAASNITLIPKQLRTFETYIRQIILWNRKTNLIARSDIQRIAKRHIYESLLLTKAADMSGAIRVLDIGSGAGMPGIPLNIWNPDIELTIFESNGKKVIFLDLMSDMLGLKNLNIHYSRVENADLEATLSGAFDIIVARAVAPLEKLLAWSEPFIRNGLERKGICIFPKGSNAFKELKTDQAHKWILTPVDLTPYIEQSKQRLIAITCVLSNN
jgi:16S rRNA (guanine527-N7)-methyltransferase